MPLLILSWVRSPVALHPHGGSRGSEWVSTVEQVSRTPGANGMIVGWVFRGVEKSTRLQEWCPGEKMVYENGFPTFEVLDIWSREMGGESSG